MGLIIERDPDAKRPLTDSMTWGERQRLGRQVAERKAERRQRERDEARQQLRVAVAALRGIKARCDRIVAGDFGGLEAARDFGEIAARAIPKGQ